jgi:chaperonin GroEL
MKQDNLIFSEEAQNGIANGVRKIAKAVGMTLGTAGRNSVIECVQNPQFYLTNDGFSILDSIKLADPIEEIGRKFLREAVNRANKSSGDGSSTTCVLTAAILEEGLKHLAEANSMEVKRSLEGCIPIIEKKLGEQAKEISVDDVWKVASISAEDEEIGKRIGEIYQKIGKDGIIQWEAGKTPEDSYEIGVGLKMEDSGFVSPYLNDIDVSSGQILNEAKAKNVPVILVREKIASGSAFNQIFQELYDNGDRDVLLFCDQVTPEAVGSFIQTRAQRGFRVILVKMPTLWGEEWWEDISQASGAKIISQQTGMGIISLQYEDVGRLGNVLVQKDSVYIDGMKDLTNHLLALKVDGSEASILRVARLNTKTARYFVGGYSESAISYRRLKVEDAINAASEALDGGVVSGGGVALRDIATSLDPNASIGSKILHEALNNPFLTIKKNAGLESDSTIFDVGIGYDTRTGKSVDMIENGIIDPKKVVLSAVKAAVSVAAGILTHGSVILLPEKEIDQQMMMR